MGFKNYTGDIVLETVEAKQPKELKIYKWNMKIVVTEVKAAVCSHCKARKPLLIRCHSCKEKMYCSDVCKSKDAIHPMQCLTIAPHMHRPHHMHGGGYGRRFYPWARTYGGYPHYHPRMYPWYRGWYRGYPRYRILNPLTTAILAGATLPLLTNYSNSAYIDAELARLRAENAALRQRTGYEIMPDPASGRYVWVEAAN